MQQPLQHIMVPMDFSDSSFRALQLALTLSETYRAQVHLVHVAAGLDEPDTCSPPNCLQASSSLGGWLAEAILHQFDLQPTWTELSGHAATQLIRWLRHNPCDLVIVGRGQSWSNTDAIVGSTTYQLLKHANCPLLVMPRKCYATRFSRVLFPFRPVTGTLDWLSFCELLTDTGGIMHLLPFEFGEQAGWRNMSKALVEDASTPIRSRRWQWVTTGNSKTGKIGEETVAAIRETDADLLVVPPSLAARNAVGYIDPLLRQMITATEIPILYLCNAVCQLAGTERDQILSAF